MHGIAGGHRLAAGKAAEPELDGGGVAADHRDVLGTDADLIGGDLRKHGLQALPHRHRAGEDRDLAGAANPDNGRLERAAAGAFESGGDAETEEPSFRPRLLAARRKSGVIGAGQCEIKAGGKVAAFIDDGAGRARLHRRGVGNGAGRHQIAASHLDAIEAAVARDGVDDPLHRKAALGITGAAHRRRRHLVGFDHRHMELVVRQDVGAGKVRRSVVVQIDALIRVRAGIADHRSARAEQASVVVESDLDVPVLIPLLNRRHEMLAPVLDPFDRPSQQEACRRDRHLFGIENELCAKSAADIGRDDADAILVEPEQLHDEIAGFVGELR